MASRFKVPPVLEPAYDSAACLPATAHGHQPPFTAVRRRPDSRRGFTLIELMIVVGIVAILSAVAVPRFLRLQLKSKRTEVFTNLPGIAMAEKAYEGEFGTYVPCDSSPDTPLNNQLYPFDTSLPGWEQLDWAPDGKVRCHYYVQEFSNSGNVWIRTTAVCDLDVDTKLANWWIDVDPKGYSPSSQHMVLRASPATVKGNYY